MAGPLDMAAQLATQGARSAWYLGLYEVTNRMMRGQVAPPPPAATTLPMPSQRALLEDVARLLRRDALNVRDGVYPPTVVEPAEVAREIGRIRKMVSDIPRAAERRAEKRTRDVAILEGADDLPDYYTQNFHYQTGGYLTEESAELYDIQVETLFLGTANAMRRSAIPPIARWMAGRDQRNVRLADVACGTGRLIGQIKQIWPLLDITGVDLSAAYLKEARRHVGRWRNLDFVQANAEALPFDDASIDIVATIFLFHELPAPVRRRVAAEFARVLRPGGLMIFVDSLQYGDKPEYDGLLETFPVRFHEPYYRHYAGDDLSAVFEATGLRVIKTDRAFLSKLIVAEKPAR